MTRIFISYRRADSIAQAGRIYDRLGSAFSDKNVFKDVDDIPLGADFRRVIDGEVSSCDVLLVVIGPRWASVTDTAGRRRLDDPDDFVRLEVESGLRRADMLVIPVLVGGASMPTPQELPPNLHELTYRNAAIVREDPDFNRDMTRLAAQIRTTVRRKKHIPWTWVTTSVVAIFVIVLAAILLNESQNTGGQFALTQTAAAQLSTDDETSLSYTPANTAITPTYDMSAPSTTIPTKTPSATPTDVTLPTLTDTQGSVPTTTQTSLGITNDVSFIPDVNTPLRDEPSNTGTLVNWVAEEIPIIGRTADDKYFLVSYRGQQGWVNALAGRVVGSVGDIQIVTVTPHPTNSSYCVGWESSPLFIGASVSIGEGVNIRESPPDGRVIGQGLGVYSKATILDGPVCAGEIQWWKVETANGTAGWAAEGSGKGSQFILPCTIWTCG